MKRILVAAVMVSLLSGTAFAGEKSGMGGMMGSGMKHDGMMHDGMMGNGMMGNGMMGKTGEKETGDNDGNQATQEKAAGEVKVIAAFINMDKAGGQEGLAFTVKLDTHSVDLEKFDFGKGVSLRDDSGREHAPSSVKESGSGHHREASVSFANPGGTKYVELIVRGVGGDTETTFRWDLNQGMMKE